MREFKSTSASQITTFRDCRRMWWFQSIMGLPTPQRASAALGEAVHAQLEKYLDDGTLPDESQAGKIAKAGLPLNPKPGTVWTEVSMSGKGRDRKDVPDDEVPVPGGMPRLIIAGMPINGYIDVLDVSANKPVVLDHKTTSSLDWAKTKDDLVEDVQMTIYGSYALDVCASMGVDADVVEAGHIVYLTKGLPFAQRTTVNLTREHLASERKKIAETIEEMKETAKATTPAAVPGEASVCNKYGGCHFKDKCSALGMLSGVDTSIFSRFSTPTSNPVPVSKIPVPSKESDPVSTVDPLAALAALRAKKAAAAAANPESQPAPQIPTPAVAAVESAPPVAAPVAAPAAASSAVNATLAKYGITRPATQAETPAQSIVPADVPRQEKVSLTRAPEAPAAAPVAAETEEKSVRKPKGFLAKLTALEWTPQQIERMNAEAMRAAIDGNLNGKGYSVRPDGSIYIPGVGALDTASIPLSEMPFESEEDEAKFLKVFPEEAENVAAAKARAAAKVAPSESVHPSQQVAAPGIPASVVAAPVVTAPVVSVVAPVAAPAPSLVLYIDCAPEKGREREYVLLEDYIQPMLPLVVEAYNRGCKKDDEKVPFYSLIPYARGPGFVAALVMQQPPTGVLVANTRFPATNAVLEVLIPMADVVVRGTR